MKFVLNDKGMLVFEHELINDYIPVINDLNNFTGEEKEFEDFRNYMKKIINFKNLKVYAKDIKEIIKSKINDKRKNGVKLFSLVPALALGTISSTAYGSGGGIFWDVFMEYIFPYLMDIAKVYCVIKIAQGFYEERKGSNGSGSAMSSLVEYGKWYLLFMFIPIGVELVDQIGKSMLDKILINK